MSDSSDDDAYGPALPPHLKSQPKAPVLIGPQLPPSLMRINDRQTVEVTKECQHLAPSSDRSNGYENGDAADDEGLEIGPYLPDDPRSKMIPEGKVAVIGPTIPAKREEWMLVCPKNRSIAEAVGLGPRKFLAKTPDEPRQALNAVDDEEESKDDAELFYERCQEELDYKRALQEQAEMDTLLKSGAGSSSSRNESLLSLHKKKRKIEEGKDDDQPKERRPFDRDIDLQVNGLSDKDKEKFIKKCGELGSRFKGGKRKFL